MELLATSVHRESGGVLLEEIMHAAQSKHPVWEPLWKEWSTDLSQRVGQEVHAGPPFEFFRISRRAFETGIDFPLFEGRLARSMRSNGFGSQFSLALGGVLHEMIDNVIQHSVCSTSCASPTGLAGFHVASQYVAICVVDLGLGALNSLRTSPQWAHLTSSREALLAIINQHASRREGQGEGEGFKQVVRALADRNSALRLRSGDACLALIPHPNARNASIGTAPQLSGIQMSFITAQECRPEEIAIN